MKTHQQITETWFQRVWNQAEGHVIDEMFSPATKASGLTDQVMLGPAEFKKFHRLMFALMKDFNITVGQCIEAGDRIAARCTVEATQIISGKRVKITGGVFVKIGDEKIVEAYNYFDFISLFGQLGFIPEDTLQRCLSGEHIA